MVFVWHTVPQIWCLVIMFKCSFAVCMHPIFRETHITHIGWPICIYIWYVYTVYTHICTYGYIWIHYPVCHILDICVLIQYIRISVRVSPYVGCPILHDHVPTVPLAFEGIQGFSGTTRPATGSWAWRRGRDTPVPAPELKTEVKPPEVKPAKGEEKVYIPSIDDILARLDQEDEEEQAMRWKRERILEDDNHLFLVGVRSCEVQLGWVEGVVGWGVARARGHCPLQLP